MSRKRNVQIIFWVSEKEQQTQRRKEQDERRSSCVKRRRCAAISPCDMCLGAWGKISTNKRSGNPAFAGFPLLQEFV